MCDLRTGEVLATESEMNPQISFGEDLMSRISYVMMNDDGTEKMHDAIIKALNKLAGQAAHAAGLKIRDIHDYLVEIGFRPPEPNPRAEPGCRRQRGRSSRLRVCRRALRRATR